MSEEPSGDNTNDAVASALSDLATAVAGLGDWHQIRDWALKGAAENQIPPQLSGLDSYRAASTALPADERLADLVNEDTAGGATLWPSPVSSPWMRRYPQPGLSRAISSTSARVADAVRGRPGVRRGYAHRRRTRSVYQRSRVRRETIRRSWLRWCLGSSLASAARTARSAHDSLGAPALRWSTATWWRRIKIPAVFQDSSHRDSRSHETTCVIRRKTTAGT